MTAENILWSFTATTLSHKECNKNRVFCGVVWGKGQPKPASAAGADVGEAADPPAFQSAQVDLKTRAWLKLDSTPRALPTLALQILQKLKGEAEPKPNKVFVSTHTSCFHREQKRDKTLQFLERRRSRIIAYLFVCFAIMIIDYIYAYICLG